MSIRYTPNALADIDKILSELSLKSPQAAQNVADALRNAAEVCEQYPRAFPKVGSRSARRFPIGRYPYTLYYRPDRQFAGIEILKVVHSARVRSLKKMPRSP